MMPYNEKVGVLAQNAPELRGGRTEEDEYKLQQLHDSVEHDRDVQRLRLKFAWIALTIAVMWITAVFTAVIFSSCGRTMPSLVVAAAASISAAAAFAIPKHCRRASHAAQDNASGRKDRVPYGTVRNAVKWAVPVFWVVFIIHHYLPSSSRLAFAIPFHMSETVVITLASTMTASVIGILFAVMHWLFPKEYSPTPKHDETAKHG